jgi:hypothetical protein
MRHNGEKTMKITNETTASQVAERMGPDATETDGAMMLSLLLAIAPIDTAEIPEADWLDMIEQVESAKRADAACFAANYPDGMTGSES